MRSFLRSVAGTFFLLVFLFPSVEKALHDFSHRNDFHCAEKADKHFHQEAHSCALCDYQLASSGEALTTDPGFVPCGKSFEVTLPPATPVSHSFFHLLPSRGPPALG